MVIDVAALFVLLLLIVTNGFCRMLYKSALAPEDLDTVTTIF